MGNGRKEGTKIITGGKLKKEAVMGIVIAFVIGLVIGGLGMHFWKSKGFKNA